MLAGDVAAGAAGLGRWCYIKSASDIGSAVALVLKRNGWQPLLVEAAQPGATRRRMCFAGAALFGAASLEGLRALRIARAEGVAWPQPGSAEGRALQARVHEAGAAPGCIPLLVGALDALPPFPVDVLVDARMRKRQAPPVQQGQAALVLGVGPGFTAGRECDAVIESNWGAGLGRVLWHGSAEAYSGVHRVIAGQGRERYCYAPAGGVFVPLADVLEQVSPGQLLGRIAPRPAAGGASAAAAPVEVRAQIGGVLRGLAYGGLEVQAGTKLAEVEPSGAAARCRGIGERQHKIALGILQACQEFFP